MKRRNSALLLASVLSLVAAACGGQGGDEAGGTTTTAAPTPSPTATEAQATALSIGAEDFRFTGAPAEIEAGVFDITFENTGEVEHELAFIEIGDTPIDEVGAALAPTLEGGPFPEFAENLAIPSVAEPGQTVETTALLAEGSYAIICTFTGAVPETGATTTTGVGGPEDEGPQGPPHYELGMVQPLTVTAGAAQPVLPEVDGAITASDYTFDVDVSAGSQTVNFTNAGPNQVHHGVVFAFNEGVDQAAAEQALETFISSEDESTPPPPEIDLETRTPEFGVFSAGLGATYDVEFESGRTYAVVCFIQDRTGGPPHVIAHDMATIFTVD